MSNGEDKTVGKGPVLADLCEILRSELQRNLQLVNSPPGVTRCSTQLDTRYYRDNQANLNQLPEVTGNHVKAAYAEMERENVLISLLTRLGYDRFKNERPFEFQEWWTLCNSLSEKLQGLIVELDRVKADAPREQAVRDAQEIDTVGKQQTMRYQRASLIVAIIGVVVAAMSNSFFNEPIGVLTVFLVLVVIVLVFVASSIRKPKSEYWSRNLVAVNTLRAAALKDKVAYGTAYRVALGTLLGRAIAEQHKGLEVYFQRLIDEFDSPGHRD